MAARATPATATITPPTAAPRTRFIVIFLVLLGSKTAVQALARAQSFRRGLCPHLVVVSAPAGLPFVAARLYLSEKDTSRPAALSCLMSVNFVQSPKKSSDGYPGAFCAQFAKQTLDFLGCGFDFGRVTTTRDKLNASTIFAVIGIAADCDVFMVVLNVP